MKPRLDENGEQIRNRMTDGVSFGAPNRDIRNAVSFQPVDMEEEKKLMKAGRGHRVVRRIVGKPKMQEVREAQHVEVGDGIDPIPVLSEGRS